jgi:hypothetical protein
MFAFGCPRVHLVVNHFHYFVAREHWKNHDYVYFLGFLYRSPVPVAAPAVYWRLHFFVQQPPWLADSPVRIPVSEVPHLLLLSDFLLNTVDSSLLRQETHLALVVVLEQAQLCSHYWKYPVKFS